MLFLTTIFSFGFDDKISPNSPKCRILVEPLHFLARIFHIFLGLHAHVEDGTVAAGTDDFVVHAALAALALGPQASESHLEFRHFAERFLIEFAEARSTFLAHCAPSLVLADERLLAPQACFRLLGEFHETTHGGSRDRNGPRMLPGQQRCRFFLAENRLEDTGQWLRQLVFQIVLGVDGEVVFQDVDGIFGLFIPFCACCTLYHHVGDPISKGRCRAGIACTHSFRKLGVCLLAGVVGLRQCLGDDQIRHIDFVLEQLGNRILDIAG